MEVKPGYKQTEVGVIPEEWEVMALESVARIIDPQPDHRTPPETAGGEPYIGISDFLDDETVDWDSSRKIVSRAVDKQQLSFQISPGSIIFGKIGTIGSPKFLPTVPFRFGLSANVLLIQPRIEPNFVMAWLRSNPCQRAVTGELHSTSQAAFGINKMRRVMIPAPPLPEQRAIAEVLSDVDGLLGGLDRLIAKKRDLKQAAMQQLLTGQTRLPGFHGEWETLPARDIGVFKGGSGFPLAAQGETGGEYPFFKVSDMNNEGNETFMTTANHYISEQTRKRLGATAFPADSIVFAKVGAAVFLERKKILGQASCIDNNMAAFVLDKSRADVRYVHSLLLSKRLGALVATTALPALNAKQLGEMPLAVPPLPEQRAIAAVLSDIDAELAALEARRDKTRDLKQAMMQELLTGRTRLV